MEAGHPDTVSKIYLSPGFAREVWIIVTENYNQSTSYQHGRNLKKLEDVDL